MTNITIFGTGNMGSAIAAAFAPGGHSIEHIDTETASPAVHGDIVVLAVPYPAVDGILEAWADEWVGDVGLRPRPAARPRPPIWIGGSSKPALRRVAARGDGWIPQGTPKKLMPEAIAFIEQERDRVRPGATFDIGVITEMIHVGDAGWELPPEREADVHPAALAVVRDDERAALWTAVGRERILELQQIAVPRVLIAEEVETPLLNPPLPRRVCNPVRSRQQRIGLLENPDG